jgi:hypothetical protein
MMTGNVPRLGVIVSGRFLSWPFSALRKEDTPRNFRQAMNGRRDKGILITTGTFKYRQQEAVP